MLGAYSNFYGKWTLHDVKTIQTFLKQNCGPLAFNWQFFKEVLKNNTSFET